LTEGLPKYRKKLASLHTTWDMLKLATGHSGKSQTFYGQKSAQRVQSNKSDLTRVAMLSYVFSCQ